MRLAPVVIPLLHLLFGLRPAAGQALAGGGFPAGDSVSVGSTYRIYTLPREGGGEVTITEIVNRRFFRWNDNLFLLETISNQWRSGVDGAFGELNLTAWKEPLHAGDAPVWTIQHRGANETLVDRDFYRVSEWGCCDERSADVYYSLGTGRAVIESTTPIWILSGPPEGEAVYGYDGTGGGSCDVGRDLRRSRHWGHLTGLAGQDTLAAICVWGPPDNYSDRENLVLLKDDVEAESESRHVRFASLDHPKPRRVELLLVLHPGHSSGWVGPQPARIHMPLAGRVPEIQAARVPEGFRLERRR